MTALAHSFNIGDIACTVVSDGTRTLGESIYNVYAPVPGKDIRDAYNDLNLPVESATSDLNCLLVQTDYLNVLIDAGGSGGTLTESLSLINITPEDIDLVFITHAHPDHFEGLFDERHNYRFPNAALKVGRTEWNYWNNTGIQAELNDTRPGFLGSLRRFFGETAMHVDLVDDNERIAPGVYMVMAPGHTPGHCAVLIESEDEQLLHLVDTLHSVVQFAHPDWSPKYDTNGDQGALTRRSLLERGAAKDLMVMGYHLPFPGLGRVIREQDAYAWVPAT